MIWYKDYKDGIIVSTRIRLARNIKNTPFPSLLTGEARDKVRTTLEEAVTKSNSTLSKEFALLRLDEVSPLEKRAMVEEHLISPQMVKGTQKSVLVNKDKTMSIMLMEEDHIRLQIIMAGMELDKAYDLADKVDNVMEEAVDYAFSEEFGYLTACPTNVGTGLRASVMMHLPALVMTGNITRVLQSFSGMGIAVRGLYGEGTNAEGAMYQISNSVTLGLGEKELIEKLKTVVERIEKMEVQARERLMRDLKETFIDKIMRSYGILKYAHKVTSAEAKTMLSDCLLGVNMGIINTEGEMSPLELMIKTAPSIITGEETLTADERDIKRAEFLRENI